MSSQVETEAPSIKFQQYHQPTLAPGDYTITVTQSVSITDHTAPIPKFTDTKSFTVSGERFELNPTTVEGVFPPDGNLGDHSNVLPHIVLNRSTLPWERAGEADAIPGQLSNVPWLALLLFDENQKPAPHTMKAGDLLKPPPGAPKFPKITLGTTQDPEDVLTVIDVPSSLLRKIMPAAAELTLLAHVRFGTATDGKSAGEEFAIVIGNRLPQSGTTSTAHLVSVEGRFEKVAGKYEFNYQGATGDRLIRLVSLKSWSFACESHEKDFKQLLLGLNTKPSTLRLPGDAEAQRLFSKGYVVVPHYFREGDESASWFRGPLQPGENKSPKIDLPAHSADELVRYDRALSMFDVSYAAAWQLGRLLALQDKDFSTSLYQWKRQHAQRLAQKQQRKDKRFLHLPFLRETPADLPEDISKWFENLRKFEGVPFNYLVPDERMLPPESIRFFQVDHAWVDCLADGAFSIGRVASSHHKAEKLLGAKSPATANDGPRTGFLLRSEIVSGWPGLVVDGFSDRDGKASLSRVRVEQLGAGVLLCIFAGVVARVDIHQKAEMLHFGFHKNAQGKFFKKLRDSEGRELPDTDSEGKDLPNNKVVLDQTHWSSESLHTLDIVALASSISGKLPPTSPPSSFTSALFGLQMVEGVERVIFVGAK